MTTIVVLAGAPGSGKTTVSNLLQAALGDAVLFDFGRLREPHLDASWSNASDKERQMAFENLVFILKNYIRNEYRYVIVNDLLDNRVLELHQIFGPAVCSIFSLIVHDDAEMASRVLDTTRDSGFRDVNEALRRNRQLAQRAAVVNEVRIDNTPRDPGAAVRIILDHLRAVR